MKKILILMFLATSMFFISCGSDTGDTGNTGKITYDSETDT